MASPENFNSFHEHYHEEIDPESLDEKDLFKTYNCIQVLLANRLFGYEPSDEAFMSWEEQNSERFGRVATDHPELIKEYLHGDREKALAGFEELIYEKHEV